MPFVRIFVHLVFATKHRFPFLTNEIRKNVQKHIMENCEQKKIYLQCINGSNDHLHCLISLGKEQTISQVAKLIKGESSHWVNINKLTEIPFQWQNDYYAVSVSEKEIEKVIHYIKHQEQHHHEKIMDDELDVFKEIDPLLSAWS